MEKKSALFMSVAQFKTLIGATSIEILVDKTTGNKSFLHNGQWFKVQKEIDTKLPMSFITEVDEDGSVDWMKATLINIDNSKSKKETFSLI
jgi:spore coat protein CotH